MQKNASIRLATILCGLALLTNHLVAATWTFDANTGTTGAQDGSGTWDSTTANWWTGSANSAWNSANNAQFGATTDGAVDAYGIQINGSPSCQQLIFANSGYLLTNSSAVNIVVGGSNPQVQVANGKTASIGTNVTLLYGTSWQIGQINGAACGTLNIEAGGQLYLNNPNSTMNLVGSGNTINVQTGGSVLGLKGIGIGGAVSGDNCTINVQGGSVAATGGGGINLGNGSGATGSLNIYSGSVTSNPTALGMAGGTSGVGTLNLNGGILVVPQIKQNGSTAANNSTLNFNGGTLKASTNSTAFILGLTNAVVKAGGAFIDDSGYTLTNSQPLVAGSPSGGLTKLGGGNLILTGSNTYTGGTLISSGWLTLGAGSTNGSLAGTGTVTNNATLAFNRSDNISQGTHFGPLTGIGTLVKYAAGTVTLTNASDMVNGTVLTFSGSSAGTVVLRDPAALGPAGNLIRFTAGGSGMLEAQLDSSLNAYAFGSGSGNGGTLVISRATPGAGFQHTLGLATLSSVTLTVNKGSNITSGNAGVSFTEVDMSGGNDNNPVTLAGSADITVGSAYINSTGIPKRLQLDGTSLNNTVTGSIYDGIGTVNLIKANTSTWTLQGANTYSGSTTINQGTLALGASASLTSPTIVLASNAVFDVSAIAGGFTLGSQTLRANGTVTGSLNDGSSVIEPGSAALTAGTLTVTGNLTLNGSGSINFDINSANTTGNDLIAVGGNLTLNNITAINFNFLTGSPALGVPYLVMTNTGARSGGAANLSTGSMAYVATFDDSNPHVLYVTFTGVPRTLAWQGDGGLNQWDLSSLNWLDANAAATAFLPADNVLFTNNTVNTTVDLTIAAFPGSTHVTGTNNFNFIGTGSLCGGAPMVKDGPGSFSLGTSNDFTGPVTVSGGTLVLSNAYALGRAASVTLNNGQLNLNGMNSSGRAYSFSLAGSGAGGSGLLLNNGTTIYNNEPVGDVTLLADATIGGGTNRFDLGSTSGANVLSANNHKLTKVGGEDSAIRSQTTNLTQLIVNGGRLWSENNDNNLGPLITVGAGGGVGTWGNRSQNAAVTLNGGRIVNLGNGTGTWTGSVTLTANSALDPNGNSLNLLGPVGGNYQLTQISGGTTITVASNSYTGGTVISNGTVQVGNNTAAGSILGPIAVYGYGTATFDRSDSQVITNPITGSGNMYYIGTNAIEFSAVNTGGTLGLGGPLGGATGVPATMFVNPGDAITVGTLQLSAANVSPSALIQSGGAVTATNNVVVGAWGYETSVLNLSGGQFEATNGTAGVTLGSTGNGVWNLSGGVAEVSAITLNSGSDAYGGGYDALNLTNGILRIGAGGISSPTKPLNTNYINLAGGTLGALASWSSTNAITLSGTPTLDSSSSTVTLSGIVSGPGGWVKQGTGTLVLSGAETYSGMTTVSNGTLNLAGSITGIGAGNITVEPAGALMGSGSTVGSVNVYGLIAPGASVGTLSVANAYLYGGGGYEFQLSSATSSAGWDRLYASGLINVQAAGTNNFTIKLVSMAAAGTPGMLSDFDPLQNYSWTVATGAGALLNFDPAKFAVDASAFQNSHSGTFSVTNAGNSIVVQYTATVAAPPVFAAPQMLSNGAFRLTFSGSPGAGYSIRASTNLALTPVTSWPVLATNVFGASPVVYDDLAATNYPHRFYLISVP